MLISSKITINQKNSTYFLRSYKTLYQWIDFTNVENLTLDSNSKIISVKDTSLVRGFLSYTTDTEMTRPLFDGTCAVFSGGQYLRSGIKSVQYETNILIADGIGYPYSIINGNRTYRALMNSTELRFVYRTNRPVGYDPNGIIAKQLSNPQIFTIGYSGPEGTYTLKTKDNVQHTDLTPLAFIEIGSTNHGYIGASQQGDVNYPESFFTGKIYEIIRFSTRLTDLELNEIYNKYLIPKYFG